ncbi:MAG: hypothetical protein ACOYNO_12475 [Saprospiraceae bacterium]
MKAYQELIELIAQANPQRISELTISKATLMRVQELLLKNNAGLLSAEEQQELQYFVWLEYLIGLAKAKAQALLLAA